MSSRVRSIESWSKLVWLTVPGTIPAPTAMASAVLPFSPGSFEL